MAKTASRLLGDLLRHVRVEGAAGRDVLAALQRLRLLVDARTVQARIRDAVRRDAGQVAVFEKHDAVGVRDDGRQVAGNERLALAVTDNDAARICDAYRHQHARLLASQRHDGCGAFDAPGGASGGLEQVEALCNAIGDKVGDDLGVGFRREGVAARR